MAKCSERTNGVRHMAPANMRWLSIQAVSRSGLRPLIILINLARLGGGRGVNSRFSFSGELTTHGRRMEPVKVTRENTMRLRLPMRPISPTASVGFLALSGTE